MFLVEQEAIAPTEITDVQKVIDGIDNLHPKKNSYYAVIKQNGDYLQFAGSCERLVAEVRRYQGKQFRHYVIGRDTESGLVDKIECNVGPIRINQNQVLNVSDAKKLIQAFCNNLPWPNEYQIGDVTERFL